MEENEGKRQRNIDISSSSLIALKAELLSKKAQVEKILSGGKQVIKVPAKNKTSLPVQKGNAGVEARAKRDEEQQAEEEPTIAKARIILEEKAKLYDKLSRDKGLLKDDTISEEQSFFLVDFQQKVLSDVITERRTHNEDTHKKKTDERNIESNDIVTNPDEEWVEFIDSLGRTRTCLRKDLAHYQQQDTELTKNAPNPVSNQSYGNFVKSSDQTVESSADSTAFLNADDEARLRKRQMWEEEEEQNKMKSNLHYQDILYQEARQHGAGFYAFSKDEEERAKQMAELERLRQQTETIRAQTAQMASQKQTALQERLKKVRDRKRQKLGLPPLKENPTLPPVPEPTTTIPEPTIDADKEAEEKLRQKAAQSLPQSVKIRAWDYGKEGMPKKPGTVPVMSQEIWVEKKREERVQEFAPPSTYSNGQSSAPRPRKIAKKTEVTQKSEPIITEESIEAGLAFFKSMQFSGSSNEGVKMSQPEESDDDQDLLPPGEQQQPSFSSELRWQTKPARGVAIPPPTSMEYFTNSNSHRKKSSIGQRPDLTESFKMGLKQQRK